MDFVMIFIVWFGCALFYIRNNKRNLAKLAGAGVDISGRPFRSDVRSHAGEGPE
jgi:hypothetical protein